MPLALYSGLVALQIAVEPIRFPHCLRDLLNSLALQRGPPLQPPKRLRLRDSEPLHQNALGLFDHLPDLQNLRGLADLLAEDLEFAEVDPGDGGVRVAWVGFSG